VSLVIASLHATRPEGDSVSCCLLSSRSLVYPELKRGGISSSRRGDWRADRLCGLDWQSLHGRRPERSW
jgi:hypothetical protein